jgi:hypothetical protein
MSSPPSILEDWSQGDASLDVRALPYVNLADEAEDVAVEGVVVLTQTCDICNAADGAEIPALIQVAGLIEVDDRFLEEVRRYRMPRYLYVPAVAERKLVADLNLCTSFDRAVLARWTRLPAPTSLEDRGKTAFVLGRHRSRHAFPDSWSPAFGKMRDWIRGRGGKTSDEGAFVNAIAEIRILADNVENPATATVIVLIPKATPQRTRAKWAVDMLPKLKEKVDKGWGCEVTFILQTLSEMTAEDYVGSHLMDFDALTRAANDDTAKAPAAVPEARQLKVDRSADPER